MNTDERTKLERDETTAENRGSKKTSHRSFKNKPSKRQLEMRRGGKFRFGVVRCCPEWYAETAGRIAGYFTKNGIKSKRQISRSIDAVMFVLRAQTTERCEETDWCLNGKNGEWVAISYRWFARFFHSKTACVNNLRLLRECGVLKVDRSWIHLPETEELKARYGWKDWKDSPTQNMPQGWLVNYKPKTEPCRWTDFPVQHDLNEFLSELKTTVESVGEIDAGSDELKVYLDWDAIENGLRNGTLGIMQTLRDVGLCKKYATRESWKNPKKLNADGTPCKRQRRKTDEREYHAVAMVSKEFMSTAFTGKKGTKWEGTKMVEVCDLHTGVIPSVLLAQAVRNAELEGLFSGHSIPKRTDLVPTWMALEKLQSHRVKELPDGTLTVTRDGDVYMDAVREIETRVKTDPVVEWYLGDFFKGAVNDGEKRDRVKSFLLKTVYINNRARRGKHRDAGKKRKLSRKNGEFEKRVDAHVCTIFEDVLKREFPEFTDIVVNEYKTKWEKTKLYDMMSRGEKILTKHVANWIKTNEGIPCIRKHDALVTLVPRNSFLQKTKTEQLIWKSLGNIL